MHALLNISSLHDHPVRARTTVVSVDAIAATRISLVSSPISPVLRLRFPPPSLLRTSNALVDCSDSMDDVLRNAATSMSAAAYVSVLLHSRDICPVTRIR